MWETRSTVGSTVPRQTDLDCVRKQPENEPVSKPVSSVPPRFCFSACPKFLPDEPFLPHVVCCCFNQPDEPFLPHVCCCCCCFGQGIFFYHSNRKITNIEAMLENLPGLLRADHSRQDSKWLPSGIHTTSEEAAASAD